MDSLDRQRRDAAHGPDHQLLPRSTGCWSSTGPTGSGYVYLARAGGSAAAGGVQPAYGDPAAVGGARRRPGR